MNWEYTIFFISIVHPQANGQSELTNKVILKEIKKKLDNAKEQWAEQLHRVLWSYPPLLIEIPTRLP